MNLGLPVSPGVMALAAGAALLTVSAALMLGQHDQLVTARLQAKDQQAVIYNLRRDITERDAMIRGRAAREAGDAGATAQACATTISTAYQRGVAFGRAISHGPSNPAPVAASGRRPGADVVRDYRHDWEASAFKPAAR